MRYTDVLNTEEVSVAFNGVLAVASVLLAIFILVIILKDVFSILSELYIEKKYKKSEYQKGYELGYENGYKDGLILANELMGKFMDEHQEKMDRLLNYNGDELWEIIMFI